MGENEGLKTLNRKASATIKEGTTKGSRSVEKIEEAVQRGVKKAGDSLIEAPSKIETLDDDNSSKTTRLGYRLDDNRGHRTRH